MNEIDELQPTEIETPESAPLSVITTAEIDAQVSTAKKYPRRLSRYRARATEMATYDVETAQSCIYSVPRAGKKLTGPSVRFAEIIASAWGNLRIAGRTLGNNEKVVTSEGLCHDLESNTAWKVEVQRKITGKDGKTFSDDMIVVTGSAARSIAMRDAILRTIPRSEQKIVFDKVKKVALGEPGSKTFATRRDDCMSYFKSLAIGPERVLGAVGRLKVEDIDLEDLETLVGLATALRNKETTPDEAFPEPKEAADVSKGMNVGGPKP